MAWEIAITVPSDPQTLAWTLVGLIRGDRRTKTAEPLATEITYEPDPKGQDMILSPRQTNERGKADCSSLVRADAAYHGNYIGVMPTPGGYHAFIADLPAVGTKGTGASYETFEPDKHPGRMTAAQIRDTCILRGMNGGKPLPLHMYHLAVLVRTWPAGQSALSVGQAEMQKAESHYKAGGPTTRSGAVVKKLAEVVRDRSSTGKPPANVDQYKAEITRLREALKSVRQKTGGGPSEVDQAAAAMEAALSAASSPAGATALSKLLEQAAANPQNEALSRILAAVREVTDQFPGALPPQLVQQAGGIFPAGYGYGQQAAPQGYQWAQDPYGNVTLVPAMLGPTSGGLPPGWAWGTDSYGNPTPVQTGPGGMGAPQMPQYPTMADPFAQFAQYPDGNPFGSLDSLFAQDPMAAFGNYDIASQIDRMICPGGTCGA